MDCGRTAFTEHEQTFRSNSQTNTTAVHPNTNANTSSSEQLFTEHQSEQTDTAFNGTEHNSEQNIKLEHKREHKSENPPAPWWGNQAEKHT